MTVRKDWHGRRGFQPRCPSLKFRIFFSVYEKTQFEYRNVDDLIPYVNNAKIHSDEQLKRWGEFSSGRDGHSLGFPKECPTFRVDEGRSSAGSMVLVDSTIMRIDRIIAELGDERPELFEVAFCWYAWSIPASSIAYRVKTTERTVYNRLAELRKTVEKIFKNMLISFQ